MKNIFVFVVLLILAATAFTQTKTVEEIPEPQAFYEYVAPQNIRDFMLTLREAGKRGFKLQKLTTLSGNYAATSSKKQVDRTVLAGILKFDGENRFDYDFFFAEGEDDPEKTLNELARQGWYFRDLISVYGSGVSDSLAIEDIFANRLRKLPSFGNIYLLERRDGKQVERSYKLLKAGVGAGKNPSAKMQTMLDEAVKEGFVPVGAYYSFNSTGLLSVDSFSGVLVEKKSSDKDDDMTEKYEYKFARGNRSEGLRKDIVELTKEGWRIGTLNYSTAVMVREKGETDPVEYVWVVADDKKYPAQRDAVLEQKPAFFSAAVFARGFEFDKNSLIFEKNAEADDYKIVKVIPNIPKQFKKKPEEFLKTVEKPEIIFSSNLQEGYIPKDLFISEDEGLMMIFVRKKK